MVLRLGAPPLVPEDGDRGLLLVDGTWRYAARILQALDAWPGLELVGRSLPPGLGTAYPRRQTDCPDPEQGLASVEALYCAHRLLGWDTQGLLETYPWREEFLARIHGLLEGQP